MEEGGHSELVRCRPWLEAAMTHGTHGWGDIVLGLAKGHYQFWPAPNGAAITEIVVYPKRKVLNIFLAGGDLGQLLDMQASAAAWAKAQGCDALMMTGRAGWKRVLTGWREVATVMEIAI